MKNSFEYIYKVQKDDIDELKHVNNLKYLEWALKIAEKHWKVLSDQELRKKYYWVVGRHKIDYFRPSFLDDEIRLKTWIEKMHKAYSIRVVEMYKGEKLISRVKTTWVLIDADSNKVSRIPPSFQKFL